jgi:hypothetical protein
LVWTYSQLKSALNKTKNLLLWVLLFPGGGNFIQYLCSIPYWQQVFFPSWMLNDELPSVIV